MEWFEVLKKHVSKTAKGAVKVSNDAVEYTKLKIKLAEINGSIEELYIKIGKSVYNSIKNEDTNDTDVEKIADEITDLLKQADEVSEKLSTVTNKKVCAFCGTKVSADSSFCPSCGERIE